MLKIVKAAFPFIKVEKNVYYFFEHFLKNTNAKTVSNTLLIQSL